MSLLELERPAASREGLRPLLKWAGGKTWLVPRLRDLFAPFRDTHKLVEPFVGSAAVALGLAPERAFLSDLCAPLIAFHVQVANGRSLWPAYPENTEAAYYEARARLNSGALSPEETAAIFYYLNKAGFNGLCRFNSSGGFNVPYGKRKTVSLMTDFQPWRDVMRGWRFDCVPWEQSLEGTISTEFVYADPPYDATFVGYTGAGFGWHEQTRLATALAKHPGPVVASNSATDRVLNLYRGLGFDVETIEAPRRISCNGDRANALEMLATRNIK